MSSGLQQGQQEHSSPAAEQQQWRQQPPPPQQQRQVGPAEGLHLVAEEQQQGQQGDEAEEWRVRRRKAGKKRKRAALAAAAAAGPTDDEGTIVDAPAPAGRDAEDASRESLQQQQQQQVGSDAAVARAVSRSWRAGPADGSHHDGPIDSAGRGGLQQPAAVAAGPATGSKGRTTFKARSASVARTRADEVAEQTPVAVAQLQAEEPPGAVGGEAEVPPPAAATARGRAESVGREGTPSRRRQQSEGAQAWQQRHETADGDAYCDAIQFTAPGGDVDADHDDQGAAAREAARQGDAGGGEAHEAAGDGSFPRRHGMGPQLPTASVTESVAQSNAYDPRRAARAAGACSPHFRPSDRGPSWLSQGLGRAMGPPRSPAGAAQRPEAGPAASNAGPPARQGGWPEAGQQVPRRPVPPPPLFNAPSTADINMERGRSKGGDAIGSGGDGDMGRAGFQAPAAFYSLGDGVPAAHRSTHGFWNVQAAARQAAPQGGGDEQLYGTANAGRTGSIGIRPRVTLASRLRTWQDPYEMVVDMDEEEGAGDACGRAGHRDAPASRPGPSWQSQHQQQQPQQGGAGRRPDPRRDGAGAWRIEPQTRQPSRSAFPQGPQWAREAGPGAMAHAAEPQMSAAAAAGRAVPAGLHPAAAPASQPAAFAAYERNCPTRMYGMQSSYSGGGDGDGMHDVNPNQDSPDASYNCGRRHAPLAPAPGERSPRSPRDPRVWPRRAPSGAAAAPSHREEGPLPCDGEAPLRFAPHGEFLARHDIGSAGAHGMYDNSYGATHTDDEGVDAGGGGGRGEDANVDAFGAGMRPERQHPAARYPPQRHLEPYADEELGGHPHEEHVGLQEPQELQGQLPHPGQRPSGFSAALFGQAAAGCAGGQSVPSHRDVPHLADSAQHIAAASVGPQAPARVDGDTGSGWGVLRGQPGQGPRSPNMRDFAKHPMPPPPLAQPHQQQEEGQGSGQHRRGRFVAPLQPQQQQSAASGQHPPPPPRQQPPQQPEVFRVPSLRTGALGFRVPVQRSRANDEREGSQGQPQLSRQPAQAGGGGAGLLRPAVNPLGQPQPQPPGACAGQAAASISVSAASQKIFRALHRSEQTTQRLKARMQGVAETEEEGWTLEQVQALQTAYFRVEPTHPQFWKEVARHVPGRTAGECFMRVFCSGKDAEERALLRKVMPKMRRLQPAGASGASTSGRPVTLAAARRYSQKMHERDQLERLAHLGLGTGVADESSEEEEEEGDEGAGPAGAGGGQRRRLRQRRPQPKLPGDPTELRRILDDLQKKQQADRFVTSFLHRQGGWVKWHKAARAAQERMHSGQAPAATQAPAMGPRRAAEAAGAAGPAGPASGAGSGAALSQAQNDRGIDDALTRYIRRILAQDEARKVRQAWREDDEAEGLEYDGSADENDVDEEVDEEEEARLRQFLMAEGLVGPDGMPVLV